MGKPDARSDEDVRVAVRGDEEVRPPVSVHVADGGAGVPSERVDARRVRAFGERPVAVVPEQRV